MSRAPTLLLLIVALVAGLSLSVRQAHVVEASTFTVNSANDTTDGTCNSTNCTLREAIAAANAHGGADTISFGIGSGAKTINVGGTGLGPLPTITGALTIDGTTQPGYAGSPLIVLNGAAAGSLADGLTVTAGSSTIRGLVINQFLGNGIRLATNGSNVVVSNFIGTDINGTADKGNALNGILIDGTGNNTIGGTTSAQLNVISGNDQNGIRIDGASAVANNVEGNRIGSTVAGNAPLANSLNGVLITNSANSNAIGPSTSGGAGANIIAYNGGAGVAIASGTGNPIFSNSILSNTGLGIDLGTAGVTANDPGDFDTGANNLQNYPVLTSAINSGSSVNIRGTLNSTAFDTFTIEFFSSVACDPSGYGEGQLLLGSTSVTPLDNSTADINVTFAAAVPAGRYVTATATNAFSNNSSEFSHCVQVPGADSDLDGIRDASDNCPNWPNPTQALPPWPIPSNDPDCDGFTTVIENFVGTNPILHCGTDAWPPDVNNDGKVSLPDVLSYVPVFNSAAPGPPYAVRYDLNADNKINLADVLTFVPFFNLSCS